MKVIKYKMFESSEAFVKFQEENDVNVFTVAPFISKMGIELKQDMEKCDGAAGITIACFVTYTDA